MIALLRSYRQRVGVNLSKLTRYPELPNVKGPPTTRNPFLSSQLGFPIDRRGLSFPCVATDHVQVPVPITSDRHDGGLVYVLFISHPACPPLQCTSEQYNGIFG